MSSPEPTGPLADDHNTRMHHGSQGSLFSSFVHALHGVRHILAHERNARLHLIFALIACLLGIALRLSDVELAAVFFAVILVFLAEIFNTAIERTLDLIDIRENPGVKLIKDMSAGAVLVAAGAAAVIGVAIFTPHVARLIWAS